MKKYIDLTVSSPFGERKNPLNLNKKEIHVGLDFIPDETLHVFSGFSGIIRKVSNGKKEGNYIQIYTKLEKTPFYINIFHLRFPHNWVQEKMFVRPNDDLGIAGNTGNSTGIHIHYEIFSYNLNYKFIENLKNSINFHISDEKKKRIYFDPFQLYDFCVQNNIYI